DLGGLRELAVTAEIDRPCRRRQDVFDRRGHAVDPRRLAGVVSDERSQIAQSLWDRRARLVVGREKRVRPRQQVAALGQFEVLHAAEQPRGLALDVERVSDPIGRAIDALDHRRGQKAGEDHEAETEERKYVSGAPAEIRRCRPQLRSALRGRHSSTVPDGVPTPYCVIGRLWYAQAALATGGGMARILIV